MKPYGIIYKATNLFNGMSYIGQTIQLFEKRKYQHKKCECKNKKSLIHAAIDEYGYDNFKWDILEFCYCKSDLGMKETKFIRKYSCYEPYGYNKNLGYKGCYDISDETKRKISVSSKIRNSGKSNPMYGKHHTEEHKKYLRFILSGEKSPCFGKHPTNETKLLMREAKLGKKHTKEHNKKIKISCKGINKGLKSEDHKKKLSISHLGKKESDETKKKKSISAKRAWYERKNNF